MADLELFACDRLATKLTRASCGQRYERAQREAAGKSRKGQQHLAAAGCTDCPIGAAHARDEEPEVELVQLGAAHFKPGGSSLLGGSAAPIEPPADAPPADPPPKPAPSVNETKSKTERETEMSNAKTFTYRGKELTVAELAETDEAKANGLTVYNLYDRLKRMPAADAVSAPKTRGRPNRRPSTKARRAPELPAASAPTKPVPAKTSATVAPLRLVLYAAGVEVAESTTVETWAEAMRLVQAEG